MTLRQPTRTVLEHNTVQYNTEQYTAISVNGLIVEGHRLAKTENTHTHNLIFSEFPLMENKRLGDLDWQKVFTLIISRSDALMRLKQCNLGYRKNLFRNTPIRLAW